MSRVSSALILVVGVLVLFFFFATSLLSIFIVGPPSLQLDVVPNGIPLSGAWSVRSYLFFPVNSTKTSVDSTVRMTAALGDRTEEVATKASQNGIVSFDVPTDAVGVRFDASYQNYTGSVAISGPTVISETNAEGLAAAGIVAGVAYLDKTGDRWAQLKPKKVRLFILLVMLPAIALFMPIYYIVVVFPPWYGKGWAPSSVFGIPEFWAILVPVFLAAATYVAWFLWPPPPSRIDDQFRSRV